MILRNLLTSYLIVICTYKLNAFELEENYSTTDHLAIAIQIKSQSLRERALRPLCKHLYKAAQFGSFRSFEEFWHLLDICDAFNINKITVFEYLYKLAYEEKSGYANLLLGKLFLHGRYLRKAYPEALNCFTVALEREVDDAYINLGYMHYRGFGLSRRNIPKAIEYFEKALTKNMNSANYYLGVIYYKGMDVKQDFPKAFDYFQKVIQSCNNYPAALYYLATMHLYHKGIEQDIHEGVRLLNKTLSFCKRGTMPLALSEAAKTHLYYVRHTLQKQSRK